MTSQDILREAQQLKGVSRRLESIAEQHSHITEALLTIWDNPQHGNDIGSAGRNEAG